MLYNAALGQQAPNTPAASVDFHPSAKLLRPFYWAAAIIVGLIFFYSNNTGVNLYWLLVIPAVIVVWTFIRQVRLRYTKLSVLPGKVRYETGLFSRSIRTMDLAKIQDVRVDQTLLDRLLSLGTISIETAGETSRLEMAGVEEPQQVADYILDSKRR